MTTSTPPPALHTPSAPPLSAGERSDAVERCTSCPDDGSLDEVVGFGHFHIEKMRNTHYWINLGGLTFDIVSAGRVEVRPQWGSLEDWRKHATPSPPAPSEPAPAPVCAGPFVDARLCPVHAKDVVQPAVAHETVDVEILVVVDEAGCVSVGLTQDGHNVGSSMMLEDLEHCERYAFEGHVLREDRLAWTKLRARVRKGSAPVVHEGEVLDAERAQARDGGR